MKEKGVFDVVNNTTPRRSFYGAIINSQTYAQAFFLLFFYFHIHQKFRLYEIHCKTLCFQDWKKIISQKKYLSSIIIG